MTAYVVDGLWQASRAGFNVDQGRISRGRTSLRDMIDTGRAPDGAQLDSDTRAFMVYALNESGDTDARYVNDLFNRRGELQPYGRALLALTLKLRRDDGRARQVAAEIEQSGTVNEFGAHWESKQTGGVHFSVTNDVEATALSIKALARIASQSRLLPLAARWLVNNRRNGYYWDSTKHTALAISGLAEYIRNSRELSPDYTLEVYLNGEQLLSQRVTSAEAARAQAFTIERKAGAVARQSQLRVVKKGPGALYVSAALSYFTSEAEVAPRATPGLTLTREYMRLRLDDRSSPAKWTVEPLTGELRSGDLIVSRLRVRGSRGQYLMIEDPIPAGCEQVEQASGIDFGAATNNWSSWYSNREFRDNRTVIFAQWFRGDDTFQYAMRVQQPGQFMVAPARAEMMYEPTVQSNSASTKLTILDKK
jgi:uncharacterized protein YfaS (alpha-2-macroglobulin family)